MNERCLVTLVLGEFHQDHFERYFRPGWQRYCERHGIDLLAIDEPLDQSARARTRSPAWQKCLILSDARVRRYQRVAWIDADILIHPKAPDVFDHVRPGLVGAVDAWDTALGLDPDETRRHLQAALARRGIASHIDRTPQAYHLDWGLPSGHARVVQTGLLILEPAAHEDALLHAYEHAPTTEYHYEMPPLSHEIQARHEVDWLDNRFNLPWLDQLYGRVPGLLDMMPGMTERLLMWASRGRYASRMERIIRSILREVSDQSWFLHFAGSIRDVRYLDKAR